MPKSKPKPVLKQSLGIIGIDPGTRGGIAVLDVFYNLVHTQDLSKITTTELIQLLKVWIPRRKVYVEKLWGFTGSQNSGPTTFKLGQSYGTILGILQTLEAQVELVAPQVWQKFIQVKPKKEQSTSQHKKNIKEVMERKLGKGVKLTNNITDATAIAYYGVKKEFS